MSFVLCARTSACRAADRLHLSHSRLSRTLATIARVNPSLDKRATPPCIDFEGYSQGNKATSKAQAEVVKWVPIHHVRVGALSQIDVVLYQLTMSPDLDTFACDVCAVKRHIADLALCSNCGRGNDYFCINHCAEQVCNHAVECDLPGHATCWNSITHIRSENKRSKHVKRNAVDHWCVEQILYSATDEETQQTHHDNDSEALWFLVNPAGWTSRGPEPCLQVTQRFEKLWHSSQYRERQHFPSFVSFIGGTGVGKSTLVRAMMMVGTLEDMRTYPQKWGTSQHWLNVDKLLECRSRGPVTRAKHAILQVKPTSEGVHLYQDATVQSVQYPALGREDEIVTILLADCEGFKADYTKPSAARTNNLEVNVPLMPRQRAPSVVSEGPPLSIPVDWIEADDIRKNMQYSSTIPIRAPNLRKPDKEGAELFYARHLYAFSDVVLFVTDKVQSLGSELRQFLQWIAKAEERELPSRSPRTLIIVINKADTFDPKYYSERWWFEHMFQDLANKKIWESSDELKALKDKHDKPPKAKADRINDNMSFFNLFFHKVRICYIPELKDDTAERLYGQYIQLRELIIEGSKEGQRNRSDQYSRYDAPTMAHLLNKAFDHFANSDKPFDFHAAARKDNPTPISLSGHISYLLRHTGTDAEQLDRFIDILTICLITYEYRQSLQAREPEKVFRQELKSRCQRGFVIYEEKFQPCALIFDDGSRCTSVKVNHGSRHLHFSGSTIPGTFDASLFSHTAREGIIKRVHRSFGSMYEELYAQEQKPSFDDMKQYRSKILGYERDMTASGSTAQPSLQHTVPSEYFLRAKSNKTCFACLQAAPDHFLPCGHGFCSDCVKDFGKTSEYTRYQYVLDKCVLCGPHKKEKYNRHTIRLDPRAAGVRILTLDGGGIRGIIELAFLKKIEERVNLNLPIRDLFDLIIGTSTGGIISLAVGGLTHVELSISELTQLFEALAKTIFERDRLALNEIWRPLGVKIGNGLLFLGILSSRYASSPRRGALERTFSSGMPLFGGTSKERIINRATRVAVYASSSGSLCTFSNYSRDICEPDQATDRSDLGADRGFIREDVPAREPKIWEAAMATSAAPGYFGLWRIDDPNLPRVQQKGFADGALRANMPLDDALQEKELIWSPANGPRPLDLSVSIGTGYSNHKISLPSWLDPGNVQEAVKAYHEKVLNSENVWREFRDDPRKYQPDVHYRLNLPLKKNVELDDWKAMKELSELANTPDPSLENEIDTIAYQLVANLLFYEPDKIKPAADRHPEFIQGAIWCRLPSQSASAIKLFSRIKGFYHQEAPGLQQIPVVDFWTGFRRRTWDEIKQKVISEQKPFSLSYHIEGTNNVRAEQCVYVELLDSTEGRTSRRCRISGFPICYADLCEILNRRRGVQ